MKSRRKNKFYQLNPHQNGNMYDGQLHSDSPILGDGVMVVPSDLLWDVGLVLSPRENVELFKESFKIPVTLSREDFPLSNLYTQPLTYNLPGNSSSWLSRRVKTITCRWVPDKAYLSQTNYTLEMDPFVMTFSGGETDARPNPSHELRPYGGCWRKTSDWHLMEQLFYCYNESSVTLLSCQDINALPHGEGTFVKYGGVIHHSSDFLSNLPPYLSLGHALKDGAWKVIITLTINGFRGHQQVYRSSDYSSNLETGESYVVFKKCLHNA